MGLACLIGISLSASPQSWASADGARSTEAQRDSGRLVPQVAEDDHIEKLPEQLEGLQVDEKLGAEVPQELAFRDETGAPVKLGDYFDNTLPTILTFNYSNCPMLCSVQIGTLVQALQHTDFDLGKQFRIVTIGLDPAETPEQAMQTKERYLSSFPEDERETAGAAWHFLLGDKAAVDAATDAVGFRYRYLEKTKEYVHPATLIFLSPWGTVTRYFHGVGYEPKQLDLSIFQAGAGEHGVSLGFLLACFTHDPDADDHTETTEQVMRYGALGFVFVLLLSFGIWQLIRYRRGRRALDWNEALQGKRDKGNQRP
ncbi:Uncharacterized protein SCO1/SenC/PrrC involved in biogenesis of respiratory and photosynthetic systems- like protein [Haliangium ochraceum DSM 14365]|uniref:Uncharacterized protein SCO1/SenC/PrrC involved in biogenesis of respiratory and photosynthetic systems-like protein n=2 Tax=Haliangium ochraceum TaxID=80816 RepID=D0LJA8_HALO1|nr:Uncharacterized protein SCO1/SenC/PrrC involved in biogenesis of respiratory and photosynthetic systems- like protein [Haliangium ochraceum DSM 14365]